MENINHIIQKKKSKHSQELQVEALREFKNYNNRLTIMDCRHIKHFQQTLLPWIKLRLNSNQNNKTKKPLTRLQKKKISTTNSSSLSSSSILPQKKKRAQQFIIEHLTIIKYNLIMDAFFSQLHPNECNKIMNSIFQTVWSMGTQTRGIKSFGYIYIIM